MKRTVFLVLSVVASAVFAAEPVLHVKEGRAAIKVVATAPIPEEVDNESQAKALSREAAVVRGQTALLTHILKKQTRSKKTLAEAEIPSLELQSEIRGYVQGARVVRTEWTSKQCEVTLVLDKSKLKDLLRKN